MPAGIENADPHVRLGALGGAIADAVAQARDAGKAVLVTGGNCSHAPGVLGGFQDAHGLGARIGLVWFDAHGDFNTPKTTITGSLGGMPVAVCTGLALPGWREGAHIGAPLPTDRIVLVGLRNLDPDEERLIRATDAVIATLAPSSTLAHRNEFPRTNHEGGRKTRPAPVVEARRGVPLFFPPGWVPSSGHAGGTSDRFGRQGGPSTHTSLEAGSKADPASEAKRPGVDLEQAVADLAGRVDTIYLHVDADILDQAYVPSHGTGEPNGPDVAQVLAAIDLMMASGKVVASAVVSVPYRGHEHEVGLASGVALVRGGLRSWRRYGITKHL